MDVRAELAAAGSHAALGFSGADPVVGAAGLDQHPLDGGRGGRLHGRHRRGADEDAVDGHQREAVGLRPAAGQVLCGPLRGADAAADADRDVGPRAQLGVGGQQEVVEVLPGVVAAGAAALDVHDDRLGRHLGGDPDDRADLLDGARLEHDVADADLVELLDQRDGLFQFGDARTDDDAVDRRAGLARLLHQPLAADLELPQVRVEEQRVELDGAARLEQLRQLGDAVVEDLLGDLAAAGELGPVAGVRGRRDDLGVDGGRGHAREQDRRPAGQPGELRRQLHRAVGQGDQPSGHSSTTAGPPRAPRRR